MFNGTRYPSVNKHCPGRPGLGTFALKWLRLSAHVSTAVYSQVIICNFFIAEQTGDFLSGENENAKALKQQMGFRCVLPIIMQDDILGL